MGTVILSWFIFILLIWENDSLQMASCAKDRLQIWNNMVVTELDSKSCVISKFSNDYLLSGYKNGDLKAWNLSNFSLNYEFNKQNEEINSIEQISDEIFATGSENIISFWNLTNNSEISLSLPHKLVYFKISQDKSVLVCLFRVEKSLFHSSDSVYYYWDKSLIKFLNTTSLQFTSISKEENSRINCIEVVESEFVAYCYREYFKIFDFVNNDNLDSKKFGYLSSIKYLNSSLYAVAYFNGKVELINKSNLSKKKKLVDYRFSLNGIKLKASGSLLAFSYKKYINVWNLETNKRIALLKHDDYVNSFIFLNDSFDFKSEVTFSEHVEQETISIKELPIETLNLIINSDNDISDCLSNCSNRGTCVLSEGKKFSCLCEPDFGGNTCQLDLKPCSSNPCLNNGTCFEVLNKTTLNSIKSYECECNENFYGKNCQFERNVCENETCSSNGVCQSKNYKAKCKCFSLYEGDKCEIEKQEKIVLDRIIKTSTIIAMIFLLSFFLIIIMIDLSGIFMRKRKANETEKMKKFKLIYNN